MTKHYEALALIDQKDAEIVALNAENKQLFEQGISIMHDQGAENIFLKEENVRLDSEWKKTHDWNNQLVAEHYALKAENAALRKALEKATLRVHPSHLTHSQVALEQKEEHNGISNI